MAKSVKYFSREKRMLKIAGISFSGNESLAYRVYSILLIFLANFMFPVLEFRELFTHDIEVISDMLNYLFAISIGLAKTIVMFRNRIQFGKMLEKLEKAPFAVDMERGGYQEKKLNEECIWITEVQVFSKFPQTFHAEIEKLSNSCMVTLVYWLISFSTMYAAIIYTLIKRIRSSDYRDWEFNFGPLEILNVTYSPNYEISWMYQNISMTLVGAHFLTIDLLMAAVLAHISYQFIMLQNNIRRITVNSFMEMQTDKAILLQDTPQLHIDVSKIPWEYLHKHLKKTIRYHLEVNNLAKEMEQVFSQLLLLIFLGTLGLLCFSIYRSSVVQDNLKVLLHMLEAACGSMQVLTVCYWGEQVMFESQKVAIAAYEADFVGTDIRFQRSILNIIQRSQIPSKVTAGKFTDICLATFAWIIRTSYSAFMVVRSGSSKKT